MEGSSLGAVPGVKEAKAAPPPEKYKDSRLGFRGLGIRVQGLGIRV